METTLSVVVILFDSPFSEEGVIFAYSSNTHTRASSCHISHSHVLDLLPYMGLIPCHRPTTKKKNQRRFSWGGKNKNNDGTCRNQPTDSTGTTYTRLPCLAMPSPHTSHILPSAHIRRRPPGAGCREIPTEIEDVRKLRINRSECGVV